MSKHTDNRNIRVLQFLDAYENQESLWNPALESYKNKTARDKAYADIIKELDAPHLTIHDVKLKVKSIRTTYTKELRLLTKYKDEGKQYSPKLFWFNRANVFLKNVSLARDKRTGILEKNDTDYKAGFIDYLPTDITNPIRGTSSNASATCDFKNTPNTSVNINIEDNIDIIQNHSDVEESTLKYTASTVNEVNSDHIKDTAKDSTTAALHTSVLTPPIFDNSSIRPECTKSTGDEYDIFCQSVAAQLRSIADSYSRSVAKLKIQQILFEAETGHYRNNPCITIPVSQHLNM